MPQCSLTLLLSGIEKHLQNGAELPAMPALQALLSKGRHESLKEDFSSYLFGLFHLQADAAYDLPVASLSALGDGLDAANGWWLRADLVHMVADRDQLYLSACNALNVTPPEAEKLLAELNSLYAEDGWQFFAATPQRWYLRLPQSLAMRTISTVEAMGQRVGEVLPRGDDALVWQRSMTEMQMLLHSSPVNAQRSEQGLLAINSLWFWGGGALPEVTGDTYWSCVVADDPLALGLARLHGLKVSHPAETSLVTVAGEEHVLWQANIDSLAQSDTELFEPLFTMLRSGEVAELVIALPGIGSWHIDHAALRRWWRRRKPLASLLQVAG